VATSKYYFNTGGDSFGGDFIELSSVTSQNGPGANIWERTTDPLSVELRPSELSMCTNSSECGSAFICIDGVCVDRSGFQQTGDPNCGNAVDTGGSYGSGGCIDSGCVNPDPECPSGIIICRPNDEGVVSCECAANCNGDAECGSGRICVDGRCIPAECSVITALNDCGLHFECIDGRCFPDLILCDGDNPCPYGYSCVNGVCWPDPVDCEVDNDCELGYDCVDDGCLQNCVGDTDCGIGYRCEDGYCRPQAEPCNNGQCPSGYDCVDGVCLKPCNSGNCADGYVCIGGHCWPEDYECPPGTTFGPNGCRGACSSFCDSYFKTYGKSGPGCSQEKECDVCNECSEQSLCVTIEENNPCWCVPPQDAPYCFDCSQEGAFEQNCEDCQYCAEMPSYLCSCGVELEGGVKICRTACENGGKNITQEELEEAALVQCGELCGVDSECYGFCDVINYEIQPGESLPACPTGYSCGQFSQFGQVQGLNMGSYCQNVAQPGGYLGDGSTSSIVLQATNLLTGETDNISFWEREKGTRYSADAPGPYLYVQRQDWGLCEKNAATGSLYDLTIEGPMKGAQYTFWFDPSVCELNTGGGSYSLSPTIRTIYRVTIATLHSPTSWVEHPTWTPSFTAYIPVDEYDITTLKVVNLSSCSAGQQTTLIEFNPVEPTLSYTRQECLTEGLPPTCLDALLNNPSRQLAVSIIDEDDSYGSGERNLDWNNFRAAYPSKPFALLIPGENPLSVRKPDAWDGFESTVGRPNGQEQISDYYEILKDQFPRGMERVDIWVDTSGSMTANTVSPDLEIFISRLQEEGIQVVDMNQLGADQGVIPNGSEKWIAPHAYVLTGDTASGDSFYCADEGTRVQMCMVEASQNAVSSEVKVIADMESVELAQIYFSDCIGGVDYYQGEITGVQFGKSGEGVVTITSTPVSSDAVSRPFFRSLQLDEETGEWVLMQVSAQTCTEVVDAEEVNKAAPPLLCTAVGDEFAIVGVNGDQTAIVRYNGCGDLSCVAFDTPFRGFYVTRLDSAGSYLVEFYYGSQSNLNTPQPPLWSQTFSSSEWRVDQYTLPQWIVSNLPRGGRSGTNITYGGTFGNEDDLAAAHSTYMRDTLPNNPLAQLTIPDVINNDPTKRIIAGPIAFPVYGGNTLWSTDNDPYDVIEDGKAIPSGEYGFDLWPTSMGGPKRSRGSMSGVNSSFDDGGQLMLPFNQWYGGRYLSPTYMHGAQGIYGFVYGSPSWDATPSPGIPEEAPCVLFEDVGNISWHGQCEGYKRSTYSIITYPV